MNSGWLTDPNQQAASPSRAAFRIPRNPQAAREFSRPARLPSVFIGVRMRRAWNCHRRVEDRGARCSVIATAGSDDAAYHRGPSPPSRIPGPSSLRNQRCSALAEGADGCCLRGSACGTRSDGEGMERSGLFAVVTCSLIACKRLRMDCHCAQSSWRKKGRRP